MATTVAMAMAMSVTMAVTMVVIVVTIGFVMWTRIDRYKAAASRRLRVLGVCLAMPLAVSGIWDTGAVAIHECDIGRTRWARHMRCWACCRSTIKDCLFAAFEPVIELSCARGDCYC